MPKIGSYIAAILAIVLLADIISFNGGSSYLATR